MDTSVDVVKLEQCTNGKSVRKTFRLVRLICSSLSSNGSIAGKLPKVKAALKDRSDRHRRKMYGLRDAEFTYTNLISEEVEIPFFDKEGGILTAVVVRPSSQEKCPTVMMRTPYGKEQNADWLTTLAHRGFACVGVDSRGRDQLASGSFFPIQDEVKDAEAAIDWILAQPWYDGHIGVHGVSYDGFCAYSALGGNHRDKITCIAPTMSCTHVHSVLYNSSGAINFELAVRWLYFVMARTGDADGKKSFSYNWETAKQFFAKRDAKLEQLYLHAPLREIDEQFMDKSMEVWQELFNDPSANAPFWEEKKRMCTLSEDVPPLHIVAGWYDFFFAGALEDYVEAKASGAEVYITIIDASHWSLQEIGEVGQSEVLNWYDTHMKGSAVKSRKSVRCQLQFSENWLEMDSFPPRSSETATFHLASDGRLCEGVTNASPVSYTFDPESPTPAIGGASFHPRNCGPLDQAEIEKRADVLVSTSMPFVEEMLIVGQPTVTVYVKSELQHFDIVARLCLVINGKSYHVCDGMSRQGVYQGGQVYGTSEVMADGTLRVSIVLSFCAIHIKPGQSLRLHVCSAAHPRWMRNMGTGDPIATCSRSLKNKVEIFRDIARPSAIQLPLLDFRQGKIDTE